MAEKNYLDNNGLLYLWTKLKAFFVAKDGNKVLSDKNFTEAYEEKLKGLNNYTLPTASAETLGGIKVGAGLEIQDGVLNATGGGTADSVEWSNVQNRPTNVSQFTNDAGYQNASQVQSAITNATQDLASKDYVDGKTSTVLRYKGTVANREALPSNAEIGDSYNLQDTGGNVAWDGTKWDDLSETIDLTGYVEETDLVAITNGEIDDILAS